jgi:hypothetical protein
MQATDRSRSAIGRRSKRSSSSVPAESLTIAPIERLSLHNDRPRIEQIFERTLSLPLIVTDATADWPARSKWRLSHFAQAYGSHLGVAPLNFGARAMPGRATTLKVFIENLGEPYSALPGVWLGNDQSAAADEPFGWSFAWDPFTNAPELIDDVSPFPAAVANMTASLPKDVYDALQAIHRRRFHAIYISRAGTVTPIHTDWHHTMGCLAQFEGRKKFVVLAPARDDRADESGFDPENPDFDRFPAMRGRLAYSTVLQPGEMLIIPPDWPHYARSIDHTVTLSHIFFNSTNLAAFMRCVEADAAGSDKKTKLLEEVRAHLGT